MEMGAAAVLVNTAIATAQDPPAMARAFGQAVAAGRTAYLAGLPETSDLARASSHRSLSTEPTRRNSTLCPACFSKNSIVSPETSVVCSPRCIAWYREVLQMKTAKFTDFGA